MLTRISLAICASSNSRPVASKTSSSKSALFRVQHKLDCANKKTLQVQKVLGKICSWALALGKDEQDNSPLIYEDMVLSEVQ